MEMQIRYFKKLESDKAVLQYRKGMYVTADYNTEIEWNEWQEVPVICEEIHEVQALSQYLAQEK